MEAIDLSKTLRPYEGKWVALTKDYEKVIASGKTLKEARSKVKNMVQQVHHRERNRTKKIRYTYVSPLKTELVPVCSIFRI